MALEQGGSSHQHQHHHHAPPSKEEKKNPTMNIILLPANISGGQLAVTLLPSDKNHQH